MHPFKHAWLCNYTIYNEKYFSYIIYGLCPNLEGIYERCALLQVQKAHAHNWSEMQCRVHKQGWPVMQLMVPPTGGPPGPHNIMLP